MNTKIGIALLRISIPTLMLVNHGLGKLQRYEKISTKFPDPLGIGSPLSLILVIFAEVFCSLLVALGLGTRFFTIPLIITMFVACFIFHAGDPFVKKELSLIFLLCFTTLFFTGSGGFGLGSKLIPEFKNKTLRFLFNN